MKEIDENDKMLSTQEAAKRCFVSARTIRNWIQQYDLKAYQTVGGQYKLKLSDLKEFVKKTGYTMQGIESDKKKILCVDDQEDILKILTLNLTALNYSVETATNGIEAGTKVMSFKPDLIIIDMVMPEMDGFETIEYFKNFEPTKNIPIIALTSLSKASEIERIYKVGADSYLHKPIKIKELKEMIKRVLNL